MTPTPTLPRRRGFLASLLAVLLWLCVPALAQAAATDWPTYHRDNFRDGTDPYSPTFTGPLNARWTSVALGGRIYAEPLLVGNLVIVADISNTVTALNAGNGAIVWQTKVGNPVTIPGSGFPCGNVSPDGIIGTPVVDPLAGIVYAVALEQPANYYLVGLDLQTGIARFPQVAIAPSGFDPHTQQQRSALTLANGYVYAAFGGFAGDCGTYHGWVVGVPASGSGTQVVFRNDNQPRGDNAAGFWATAGASVDGSGNLYYTSGNGFKPTFDNGNAIFKLSPALALLDWWSPSQWPYMNATDADLGSIGPAIVGTTNNMVFQSGKTGWGYLVSTTLSASGNIGNELFSGKVCNAATSATAANNQVFGGIAYRDPYIYVPCPEGIKALKLAAGPSFTIAWSGPSFHPGPPIVAGGIVWAMDTNNGSLFGLNATTGAQQFHIANLGQMTHFTTPTAGQGRIYVPVGSTVRTFDQPRAAPGVPSATSSVTRSGAPPPVPQTVAGPRPLVLIDSPTRATISSTLTPSPLPWPLGADRGRELLREFLADLMRFF